MKFVYYVLNVIRSDLIVDNLYSICYNVVITCEKSSKKKVILKSFDLIYLQIL